MADYPKMFRVRQKFEAPTVADVASEVRKELARLSLEKRVKPGQTVAITAGSRGIANIHMIIKATVEHFKSLGAKPFIVPAMGSHGGGTAEGQRHILAGYGITEEFCGCPIQASMETVMVCQTAEGFPVHFDRYAFEADHVRGRGAREAAHRFRRRHRKRADEDDAHRPGQARRSQDLSPRDPELQLRPDRARRRRPGAGKVPHRGRAGDPRKRLRPNGQDRGRAARGIRAARERAAACWRAMDAAAAVPHVDILFIDEIGKNISGAGMDTNVVGRKFQMHAAAPDEYPKVKRIVVRGLSEETTGNASGIGMAEFCTTRHDPRDERPLHAHQLPDQRPRRRRP